MPHLIQQRVGLLHGQEAETGRGFQNHRSLFPLLLWHRLLGNLQQLSDGVATLNGRTVDLNQHRPITVRPSRLQMTPNGLFGKLKAERNRICV